MNLQFITSITESYWNSTGRYCINTWDLPGEVILYIDQQEGDIDWIQSLPFRKRILNVPQLEIKNYDIRKNKKVRKFWGKSYAQIQAIRNRPADTRIIWLDADIEQIDSVDEELFNFEFHENVALMRSNTRSEDCFETGLVIFNQLSEKLSLFASRYEQFWNNDYDLLSLFRPYDALVLGEVSERIGYLNLVDNECDNIDALDNTIYREYFKHWINKDNKRILKELKTREPDEKDSNIVS